MGFPNWFMPEAENVACAPGARDTSAGSNTRSVSTGAICVGVGTAVVRSDSAWAPSSSVSPVAPGWDWPGVAVVSQASVKVMRESDAKANEMIVRYDFGSDTKGILDSSSTYLSLPGWSRSALQLASRPLNILVTEG